MINVGFNIGLSSYCSYSSRKKKTDWNVTHRSHINTFEARVRETKNAKGGKFEPHNDDAFNEYLSWFLSRYRVQILPDAYPENILEEPLQFDKLGTLKYNKLLKGGRQTSFAPVVNFVVRLGCLHVCTLRVPRLPCFNCLFCCFTANSDAEDGG